MPTLGYHTPQSDAASSFSSRSSIFEDAPESPMSWRFDTSVLRTEAKLALQARFQACQMAEKSLRPPTFAPTLAAASETRHFPRLPPAPLVNSAAQMPLGSVPVHKTVPRTPSQSMTRDMISRDVVSRDLPVSAVSLWAAPVSRSVSASSVLRVPAGQSPVSRTSSTLGRDRKDRLKIKVTCPDEDEILAIRIQKNKLRSVQELADIVSIKLNIRYCMRPDDLECRLIFQDKTLPAVELGSGDVGILLEEFIMEYIQTQQKIYVEARLKADRVRTEGTKP